MGVARSSFYADPAPAADDTALVEAMHAIKDEFEAYGWRRMQAALRQVGRVVNHKKIKRLMREHGLNPLQRRRFVATTDSDHDQPIFPDRTHDLAVLDGPNQLWLADLTYVRACRRRDRRWRRCRGRSARPARKEGGDEPPHARRPPEQGD
jgi:putative transposase